MMNPQSSERPQTEPLTQDAAREQWESAAPGWRKWEPYFLSSSWPVTARLIQELSLRPGLRVLDVGCGIGDPSLQIAAAVGPEGYVLAIDLAPEMVRIASTRARLLDLGQIEFRAAAVEDLDASTGPFDAVSSRFTIMFMLDLGAGLAKLRELLRPGGRIAVSTWAHMDVNPMFAIPSREIARVADLPKPPRDAPGPMRLCKPGELEKALRDAGFADVCVTDVKLYNFGQDPETYLTMVCELAPMLRTTLDGLSEDERRQVWSGILARLAEYEDHGVIRVPGVARVGSGVRPPLHR